jgi:hypothetical protein
MAEPDGGCHVHRPSLRSHDPGRPRHPWDAERNRLAGESNPAAWSAAAKPGRAWAAQQARYEPGSVGADLRVADDPSCGVEEAGNPLRVQKARNSSSGSASRRRRSAPLTWLADEDPGRRSPLTDPHSRDFAALDYRTYLKAVRKRSASTVNAHLTALDHFYAYVGMDRPQVRRDELPKRAPRSLDAREQKRFLRAVERRPLARDRAMGRLLFYSGVRLSEPVCLDEDDVPLSARKGKVIVRAGKGGDWREIPLMDPSARTAVAEWKAERPGWGPILPRCSSPAAAGGCPPVRPPCWSTSSRPTPTWSTTTGSRLPPRTPSGIRSGPTWCGTARTSSWWPN